MPKIIIKVLLYFLVLFNIFAGYPKVVASSYAFSKNSSLGIDTSSNWSGYLSTGGKFSAINGTWQIPTVDKSKQLSTDATWVGIGGVSSDDLIQSGTQALNDGSGAVTYQAWIEMLPAAPTTIPVTISPGDKISVSIEKRTGKHWLISFSNNSSNKHYQTEVVYNSTLSSAEWIEEAPSDSLGVLPLDKFHQVTFTNGFAVENSTKVTIAQSDAQAISMINQTGKILASSSVLTSSGDSFKVSRTSVSSSPKVLSLGRRWNRMGTKIRGYIKRQKKAALKERQK